MSDVPQDDPTVRAVLRAAQAYEAIPDLPHFVLLWFSASMMVEQWRGREGDR